MVLTLIALGIILKVSWPLPIRHFVFNLASINWQLPNDENMKTLQFPEGGKMTLDVPETIWWGEAGRIKFEIYPDLGGHVSILNSYNVLAAVDFQIPGIQLIPLGKMSTPLSSNESSTLLKDFIPVEEGAIIGKIWVSIILVDKVSGEKLEEPVLITPIEFQTRRFWGLSGPQAKSLSYWLLFIGLLGLIPEGIELFQGGKIKKRTQE